MLKSDFLHLNDTLKMRLKLGHGDMKMFQKPVFVIPDTCINKSEFVVNISLI